MAKYINQSGLTIEPTQQDLQTRQGGTSDITFADRLANSGYKPEQQLPTSSSGTMPTLNTLPSNGPTTSSATEQNAGYGWYMGDKPNNFDSIFKDSVPSAAPITNTSDYYNNYISSQNNYYTQQQQQAEDMKKNLQSEADKEIARIEADYQNNLAALKKSQAGEDATQAATNFRLGRTGTIYGDKDVQDLDARQNDALMKLNNARLDLISGIKNALASNNVKLAGQLSQDYQNVQKNIFETQRQRQQENIDQAKMALQQRQQDFDNRAKIAEYDRQVQKDKYDAMQNTLAYNMNAYKFNYQQSQDSIQNALAEKKITFDQAERLRNYNLELKKLEQDKYSVTQDALGNPVAFNTKTGKFEDTLINKKAVQNGLLGSKINAYQDAIIGLGIPEAQFKQVSAQLNNLLSSGELNRAKDLILRTATKSSTADQQNQVIARNQTITSLNEIQSLLNAYVKKTGDTNIWNGNIQKVAQYFGTSGDPELAAIGNRINLALQSYRKGMSGAAFSEKEAEEYKKIFPDITNVADLNSAKIKSLLDAFNSNQKSFMSTTIGAQNYDEIFGRPQYQSVTAFKLAEPEKFQSLIPIIEQENLSDDDIVRLVNKLDFQQGFSQVGGDTNQASLGGLSQKYESGGNPGAIGRDSTGGWSYGVYQLAHNNAQRFVQQSPYAKEFSGITFNSDAWRNKWREVAQKDPEGFKQAQEQYIYQTHAAPLLQKAAQAGLDLSAHSPVLADVIFSTAVQHGANTDVINQALKKVGPDATDEQLVKAIYQERWSGGRRFANSTPQVKRAVYNRFFGKNGEQAMALKQLQNYS